MEFNSGIEFNTENGYRIIQRQTKWFVEGFGEVYEFNTVEEAKQKLAELTD